MWEGTVREFGMDMYTLLHLKWITNEDLLHSTENPVQCYAAAWVGGESRGRWIHANVLAESLHGSPETMTILLICYTAIQNKKLKKKNEVYIQGWPFKQNRR